jgi:hypothetical protein
MQAQPRGLAARPGAVCHGRKLLCLRSSKDSPPRKGRP